MITPLSLDASSPAARPEFIIRSRRISLGGQPMSPNTSQHHNKHHLPGSSHHKPTDGRAGCVLGFATVFSTHHLISEEKKELVTWANQVILASIYQPSPSEL